MYRGLLSVPAAATETGIALRNLKLSTSTQQQWSPSLSFGATGWNTTNSTSQAVTWNLFADTQNITGSVTTSLRFTPTVAGTTYAPLAFASNVGVDGYWPGTYLTGLDGSGQIAVQNGVGWNGIGPAGGNNCFAVYVNASTKVAFTNTGVTLSGGVALTFSDGNAATSLGDTQLWRDDVGTLALRRSTNAQTFRLYETWTNSSNGAWFQVQAVSSRYEIAGKANGTGNVRPILLQHGTVAIANLPTASAAGAGARMVVSDASSPTFGATVASGGSVVTPVYSDGTNWKVG